MSAGLDLKETWKRRKGCYLKHRLSDLKWEFIYAWRRALYGYDDRDVFNMSDMFIERYKAILKDYRKKNNGLFNVPEEYRDVFNKLNFNEEETNAIIDTMIFHLEMLDEYRVEKILYGKNVYDDDYNYKEYTVEKANRVFSVMNQNKEAFMRLFGLFFWDLWY